MMQLRWVHLTIVLLIFLPLDVVTLFTEPLGPFASYLSWSIPSVHWSLSLGAVVRPLLNFFLMLAISAEFFVRSFPAPVENFPKAVPA